MGKETEKHFRASLWGKITQFKHSIASTGANQGRIEPIAVIGSEDGNTSFDGSCAI
jgi:hypothetical protein